MQVDDPSEQIDRHRPSAVGGAIGGEHQFGHVGLRVATAVADGHGADGTEWDRWP